MWLTNGNPNSQSCSNKTTRWSSADFRHSMNQPWNPLEDTTQSSQVVNTPESTACKRDVPLLVPVKHLLRPTETQNCIFCVCTAQQLYMAPITSFISCSVGYGTVLHNLLESNVTFQNRKQAEVTPTSCRSCDPVFITAKLCPALWNKLSADTDFNA